jgi:hypothetical protein
VRHDPAGDSTLDGERVLQDERRESGRRPRGTSDRSGRPSRVDHDHRRDPVALGKRYPKCD